MRRKCYPSTRTSVALTWAVPVDILRLGPSLAAYNEAKPTILQLRLCHRFGNVTSLSKLPQEILDMIINMIVICHVPQIQSDWHFAKLCYDGKCLVFDHFDEESLEEWREEALAIVEADFPLGNPDDEDMIDDFIEEVMFDLVVESDSHHEICAQNEAKWAGLIAMSNPEVVCSANRESRFDLYEKVWVYSSSF